MAIYPVSCPLPTPSIYCLLKYHPFAQRGWRKRERPMKTDLYLSQQINQTLSCTGTARTCPISTVHRLWLCYKGDADGGTAGNHLPVPRAKHYFGKLQKDTVANRIRTWSAIEEEKGQMSDV